MGNNMATTDSGGFEGRLDLDAPIYPGRAAAGLKIGTLAQVVNDLNPDTFIALVVVNQWRGVTDIVHYQSPHVDFWASAGVLYQIMIHGAYRGRLVETIGLGSTLADVEQAIGPWGEDDEDNICIPSMPGLWLEIDGLFQDTYDPGVRTAPISKIAVYDVQDSVSCHSLS